jgi:hypothetical protein
VRSIQHRGQRCPANFWSALATSNASLEFVDPDIYLLPLGDAVDTRISEDLKRNFPRSLIETVHYPEVLPLPLWAPEPVLAVADTTMEDTESKSLTFGVLRSERWFLQDFLSPSSHAQALFPSRNEIRMLRYFNMAKRAIFSLVALLVLFMVLDIYGVISRPEWAFKEDEGKSVQQRMTVLAQEKKRLEHWNILLDDRAKAWSTMEMLGQLFSDKSGILLRTFVHATRADNAPKQVKVGFVKEWKMTGFVRNEALDYLNGINSRDGITVKFAEIAKHTGDSSFDPVPPTRSLVVNLRIRENANFKQRPIEDIYDTDTSTYQNTFDLIITQRFESNDIMAIPKAKAP